MALAVYAKAVPFVTTISPATPGMPDNARSFGGSKSTTQMRLIIAQELPAASVANTLTVFVPLGTSAVLTKLDAVQSTVTPFRVHVYVNDVRSFAATSRLKLRLAVTLPSVGALPSRKRRFAGAVLS